MNFDLFLILVSDFSGLKILILEISDGGNYTMEDEQRLKIEVRF